ncbi:DedA family protein [Streptomyces sp. cmx-4-9]|uniref:DedA family protein n=1 Tax=Streptomyces sp. cmx-4-9 TaxID=2790941 RepID=UPI00397EB98A
MNALTTLISQVPAPTAYVILAAAVLAESVLLIGAFIPTLTLLLTAGALARTGELNLLLVVATASCAVVVGDALGHRTGHLLGSRLRTGGLGRRIPTAAWRRADALMARRGGQAVFLTRFVPVVRTLAPHLAGATRMPYRRIAPYSALAAPLWAGAEAGAGYAAATSVQHAVALGGPVLAITAGLAAATLVTAATVRRRRQDRPSCGRQEATAPPAAPEPRSEAGAARSARSRAQSGPGTAAGAAGQPSGVRTARVSGREVSGRAAGSRRLGRGRPGRARAARATAWPR